MRRRAEELRAELRALELESEQLAKEARGRDAGRPRAEPRHLVLATAGKFVSGLGGATPGPQLVATDYMILGSGLLMFLMTISCVVLTYVLFGRRRPARSAFDVKRAPRTPREVEARKKETVDLINAGRKLSRTSSGANLVHSTPPGTPRSSIWGQSFKSPPSPGPLLRSVSSTRQGSFRAPPSPSAGALYRSDSYKGSYGSGARTARASFGRTSAADPMVFATAMMGQAADAYDSALASASAAIESSVARASEALRSASNPRRRADSFSAGMRSSPATPRSGGWRDGLYDGQPGAPATPRAARGGSFSARRQA